jgi:anti-sigma B factor antagonist
MTDSTAFRVDVDKDQAGATVTVTGDVDLATIRPLENARDRALAGSPSTVLIDLRGVRFIDSSGLKFLIETDRMSRSGGWKLKLLKPPDTAMRVFRVTGVDRHLPFVDPGPAS